MKLFYKTFCGIHVWKQRAGPGGNCVAQSIFAACMIGRLKGDDGQPPAMYLVSFEAKETIASCGATERRAH